MLNIHVCYSEHTLNIYCTFSCLPSSVWKINLTSNTGMYCHGLHVTLKANIIKYLNLLRPGTITLQKEMLLFEQRDRFENLTYDVIVP